VALGGGVFGVARRGFAVKVVRPLHRQIIVLHCICDGGSGVHDGGSGGICGGGSGRSVFFPVDVGEAFGGGVKLLLLRVATGDGVRLVCSCLSAEGWEPCFSPAMGSGSGLLRFLATADFLSGCWLAGWWWRIRSSSFSVYGMADELSTESMCRRCVGAQGFAACPTSWDPLARRKVDLAGRCSSVGVAGVVEDDRSSLGCVRIFLLYQGVFRKKKQGCTVLQFNIIPPSEKKTIKDSIHWNI